MACLESSSPQLFVHAQARPSGRSSLLRREPQWTPSLRWRRGVPGAGRPSPLPAEDEAPQHMCRCRPGLRICTPQVSIVGFDSNLPKTQKQTLWAVSANFGRKRPSQARS